MKTISFSVISHKLVLYDLEMRTTTVSSDCIGITLQRGSCERINMSFSPTFTSPHPNGLVLFRFNGSFTSTTISKELLTSSPGYAYSSLHCFYYGFLYSAGKPVID